MSKKTKKSPFPRIEDGKKIVLHVGCSTYNPEKLHHTFRNDEWQEVRLDIDPDVKPDIVCDMTDMSNIEDNVADAVWSSHNVEHLFAHMVPVALAEFYRLIKPGGFALITLPDIQMVAEYVARGQLETTLYVSPAGPISALDVLYGFGRSIASGNEFMAHRTGFTAETLGSKLKQVGFTNIQVRRDRFDLWAVGYKLAVDHPGRDDKITITGSAQAPDNKSGLVDELDREPVTYKPLAETLCE
jgi:SAM-dependent methyltransferase